MSERKVVLVDMDGVLADFDGATNRHLESLGINVRPRDSFYYRADYTDPREVEIINELHASQGFFRNLKPIDGAIGGWNKIEALGYEPRICSSPLRTNERCNDEKLEWIERHLGSRAVDLAVIDSRKELYEGVALIDDRPTISGADTASWKHVVFDARYNQVSSSSSHRLRGWNDPELGSILDSCDSTTSQNI